MSGASLDVLGTPRAPRNPGNTRMSLSERACGPIPIGSCGLLLPQRRELRRDDILIRHVAGEDADVTGKLIHAGDERP
jgi:hypothetical protein